MRDRSTQRILEGPLAFEVLRFGTPLAFGMGLQTMFNLVDAFVISRLDPSVAGPALGAIGICDQLAALGAIMSYGLSVGAAAIMSRKHAQGDVAGTRVVAWQSLLMVLGLGLVFGVIGLVGARFLMFDVVGAKGQVAELGTQYLRVIAAGSVTLFLLLHLTTLQRALGSSKTPVTLMVTANVINLVLAVLLVYGPGDAPEVFAWAPPIARFLGLPRLELLGAAWATILARLIVLIPLLVVIITRFELFGAGSRGRPNPVILGRIWQIAWPSSVQLVVRIFAMLAIHSLVARAYTTAENQAATTALGIVFRLETMAVFVALGWGSAAQTFMGQNLGAHQHSRAKNSGWLAALSNAVMMLGLTALYALCGTELIAFFDQDPEVVRVGLSYLHHVGWSYAGLGIGIVLGSAIQGAGATRQTLALDSLVVLCFELPVALIAVLSFDAGYEVLFSVVAAAYVLFAVVYIGSYRRGRFLNHAIG